MAGFNPITEGLDGRMAGNYLVVLPVLLCGYANMRALCRVIS